MKIRYSILGILALATALAGCTEQRDLDVISRPLVKIKCDWSRARIDPDQWTIMFYGNNSATPREFVTDRPIDTLQLAPGNYKTLIVNGTLGSGIDYVSFRGTKNYDTFEAYATIARIRPNGDIVVNEPDTLASTALLKTIKSKNTFTVKYIDGQLQRGDLRYYVSDSIEYVPCRLVYRIKVIVEIENINYLLASRRVTGELHGLSGGVIVSTRMPTHTPVVNTLTFTNNNPPSATVGNVETALATFGPPLDLSGGRVYTADLAFVLTNERIHRVSEDISAQVEAIAAKIKDRIDRGVCDAGLNLEIRIAVTLPKPSPGPSPDDNGDVDVDPWGNEETQDVLL